MADVAHQYNLIGETLRTGVGDLLQGAAAGKALDMQALQLGLKGEQQKFERVQRKKEFDLKQKSYDLNKRITDDKLNDPTIKRDRAIAEAQMETANKPGTEYSIGIDQPWEKEWFDDVIMPLVEKDLGITRNENGQFLSPEGEVLKDHELKSNTDIAGVMIANMDPSHMVKKQLDLEKENLAQMGEKGYFDGGGTDAMKQKAIADQQKVVERLDSQIIDMKSKPIKYLNAQIDTLGDFMTGSLNPAVHMLKYKELSARRDGLIELAKSQNKAAGANLYQQKLYNANGDVIYSKWLHKTVSPNQDKDIVTMMNARQKMYKQTYLEKPATAERTTKTIAAITGSMGGSIALIQAYQDGGIEGAANVLRDIQNAAAVASGGEVMQRDEIADNLNKLRGKGIDPFAADFNVVDAVEKLTKELPENATDEQIREILGKQWQVLEPFLTKQDE